MSDATDHWLKLPDSVKTLKRIKSDVSLKIDVGRRELERIRTEYDGKHEVDSYRVKFLGESYTQIVDFLEAIGRQFDLKYPHDKYVVGDAIQLLSYTLERFRKEVAKLNGKLK
jgi:hypothetical protein